MKFRFPLSVLALAFASASFAQSPGIVYPALQGDSKQAVPAPRVTLVEPSPSSSAVATTAAPATAASAPATAPVPFRDPRRLDLPAVDPAVSQRAVFKDPRRLDLASADAPKPAVDTKDVEPIKIVKKKVEKRPPLTEASFSAEGSVVEALTATEPSTSVSVSKNKDGSKVIRAQVPSSAAEAEAMVTAQLDVPGYKPQPNAASAAPVVASASTSVFGVSQQNQPTANPVLEAKPLPKWVTDSLDKNSGRNQIIVMPGVTEIVRIARSFPNRLVTPFESAEVITTDENLTHDGIGGAVIVATSSDKPIGIFIQDRNSDRAIPLMLIPEDIPQRDIRFTLDESWGVPTLRNNPEQVATGAVPSAQSDYVEYVKVLMRSMAKGDVPDGHAMAPIQAELAPFCQSPGLLMRLGQMLEGSKTRIAVYTAANQTKSTVPFQEAGCYRSGVLAVSAFPRPVLEPGQDTEVYVILRKDITSERVSAKRRPTLVTQQ